MKKIVCKLLLLLGILPIISCTSDQEFYPIELSTEGVEFIETDRLTLSAEVPSDGLDFSITSIGEYANRICVSEVTIDGSVLNDPTLPITSLSGDWGYFQQSDQTINFSIAPNPLQQNRVFEFTIGGAYWVRYLRLTQKPLTISN